MLIDWGEIRSRWREYFDDLLNVRVQEDASVNIIGFVGVSRSMEAISMRGDKKAV